MATRMIAAVVFVSAMAFVGCRARYISPEIAPAVGTPANVQLYLSNQSTERRNVTLAVYVDGALRLRRSLRSVFAEPNVAHGFPDEVSIHLAPGPHTIRVVAEGTTASDEVQVTTDGSPLYVDAAFFNSSRDKSVPAGADIEIVVSTERPGFC